ncbi:hypothetical protein LJR045_000964 [Microbacterium sp. LjRoot45]|uniref:hypothetical protein n=1 Tax=Microbacterium sp. LjRoot45 TaxID=3342329 RepID=UPI003ECFCED5
MRKKASPPPTLDDNTDPADWTYIVEAIEPSVALGRYRVYLTVALFMRYGGNDGWGWSTWTLAGAHRKGARELARYRRKQAALAVRQARVDVHPRLTGQEQS